MRGVAETTRRMVDKVGEPVLLRRTGQRDIEATAVIRAGSGAELIGSIEQQDKIAVIGAQEVLASDWGSLPRRGDFLVIQGKSNSIDTVSPFYVSGELVRVEILVRG
jgi:hypothetical protein